MVRAALVVSVPSAACSGARGLSGIVPAATTATANGGRSGEQRKPELTNGVAAGAAAVVCDALVVSAWWHREHAAGNDAIGGTGIASDAGRHHAASSTSGCAGGYDAAPAGHVFCLTAEVTLDARHW
jgi:hypothetical protein